MKKAIMLGLCVGLLSLAISPPSRGDTPEAGLTFKQDVPKVSAFAVNPTEVPAMESLHIVATEATAIYTPAIGVSIATTFKSLPEKAKPRWRGILGDSFNTDRRSFNYRLCPFDYGPFNI